MIVDCIFCTPLGYCGWKRNETFNALIPCNPCGCPDQISRTKPKGETMDCPIKDCFARDSGECNPVMCERKGKEPQKD